MGPERFERELQRSCGTSLEVIHDSVHAVRTGLHPDTLQVWDVGPRGSRYMVKAILDEAGLPREPYDSDVRAIQRMAADRVHGGSTGWANRMLGNWDANRERLEQAERDDRLERFREGGAQKMLHATKHGRIYPAAHIT